MPTLFYWNRVSDWGLLDDHQHSGQVTSFHLSFVSSSITEVLATQSYTSVILLSAEYEVKLLLLSCLLAISCEKFTNEAVILILKSNEMNEVMPFR